MLDWQELLANNREIFTYHFERQHSRGQLSRVDIIYTRTREKQALIISSVLIKKCENKSSTPNLTLLLDG